MGWGQNRNHRLSIRWKLLSCLAFALINAIVRYLNGGAAQAVGASSVPIPTYEIIFFQHFFGCLFLLPLFARQRSHFNLEAMRERPALFWMRILGAIAGLVFWNEALYHMPIAQVLLLSFLGPVISTLGGLLILRERFSLVKILAICLGLLGSILIGQPDILTHVGEFRFSWPILFPICATILFSGVTLITCQMGKDGEDPTVLAGQLLLFMVPPAWVASVAVWVTPSLSQVGLLAVLGLITAFAHVCFCRAYAIGEVTTLIPVGVFKFVLGVGIGYLAFGELPQGVAAWLGIAFVFSGMLLVSPLLHSKKVQQG